MTSNDTRLENRVLVASIVAILVIAPTFGSVQAVPLQATSDHESTASVNTTASTLVVEKGNPDNYDTIQSAVNDASDGDIVEVRPGTYPETVTVDKSITLKAPNGATINGSTLGADDDAITIEGDAAPLIIGFTIEHYSVGIKGSSGDWTIEDITITQTDIGVDSNPLADADWTIKSTEITDTQYQGVRATGNGDWTIKHTTITNTNIAVSDSTAAVDASTSSGDWTIRNTTIRNSGDDGVDAADTKGNWTIQDTTIKNTDWHGVRAADAVGFGIPSGSWTIEDTTIVGSKGVGLDVGSTPVDWTVRNTTIADSGEQGVDAMLSEGDWLIVDSEIQNSSQQGVNTGTLTVSDSGSTGNWTIRNTTIAGSGDDGVNAKDSTGDWTIRNTTIKNSGTYGVDADVTLFNPPSINWTIQDSTIRNSSDDGVNAAETSTAWMIHGTLIADSGTHGVDAQESTGDWVIKDSTITDSDNKGVNVNASSFDEATGDWTIRNTTISNNGGIGVDASDSSGDWTIQNAEVVNGSAPGIVAKDTSGAWSIHQSNIDNNTETFEFGASAIDATRASVAGNATQNWWGDESGPDDNDCAGNVDCSNWLTSPSGGETSGSTDQEGTDVVLSPSEATTAVNGQASFDVLVKNASTGIGAWDVTVSVADTSVATITEASAQGDAGTVDNVIADDGSSVQSTTFGGTIEAGTDVTILTVTVTAHKPTQVDLSISVNDLTDPDANEYTIADTTGATLSVQAGPGDVTDNGNPAQDPDGDGKFEDIDGDGSFSIIDVQTFFVNRNSDAIQNNAAFFDFSGDGSVGIVDIQKLFIELTG